MNLSRKGILIGFFILLALFSGQMNSYAQKQPVIAAPPLVGDSVKTGKTLTVQDTVHFDPLLEPSIAETKSLDNVVSLYINEFSDQVLPDTFHVAVRIQVNYTIANGSTGNRLDTLRINYSKDHGYNSKAVRFYKDYYSLQVEILDVDITGAAPENVSPLLVLENMMVIYRNYVTDCSAITAVSSSDTSVSTSGELSVSWPAADLIPAYDLEWTYIDESALDAGNYNEGGVLSPALIFKNNSTRILLSGNSYRIPLLYDGDGTLYFRVRTLQYAPDNEVIPGLWSTESGPGGLGSYVFTGHERKLNWQATTSFAEEGKRKSVVQYFDGSLKGRQTVTRDNTTKTTVVAETLYDKQGRPVIQVLPSPTLSTLIAYNPLFNIRGINTAEYDKSVYDTLINADEYCATAADSMSSTSGASLYYSTLNPLAVSDQHQYIPNAKGRPFTETRYTRDNTGRIDRQSGVGPDFQIGSNHETKYYYGSPEQRDLDALFGTEAGDASHYEKNMVRDANGQYSVSYVDMHGRTVATALAGGKPAYLERLSSYDSIIQTDNLLTPVNNVIKDNTIRSSKSILVPTKDVYTFNYSLSPESLSMEGCKDSTICYDCLYDLTITISDNCNNEQFYGSPKVITLSNFSLFKEDSATYNLDTTCMVANQIDTSFSVLLEEGSYDITKVLSISKAGMQYYRDSIFIPHNTCKTYNELMLELLDSIRQNLDCTPDSATTNLAVAYREQMIFDMTPLSGQYADTISPLVPMGRCASIFDIDPRTGLYKYQAVLSTYNDAEGNPDLVGHYNAVTGEWEIVNPTLLTPEEFITNYKESWGETLLPFHPEYRLLLEYEKLISAYNWEADFFNTETFAEALEKGYLNPTGSTSSPGSNFTVSGRIDSLFIALNVNGTTVVNAAKDAINDKMTRFLQNDPENFPLQYYTVWGLATAIVKCNNNEAACFSHWNQSDNVFNEDSLCTADLDQAWRLFRSQYLLIREDWIDNYTRQKTGIYANQITAPCSPVFPDRNMANIEPPEGYDGYDGTIQDTTAAHNNLDTYLMDNCRAYAEKWWHDLAPCGYSEEHKTILLDRLIQVAYEGADKDHPFGSSTVRPSSTHTDRSFEEVIKEFNEEYYGDPAIDPLTCNAYLIPYPKPYEHSGMIANLPIIAAPDSCTCERINGLYTQFISDSSTYHSFSNYMQQVHATSISQGILDTLRNLCAGNGDCTYLEKPLLLPPALQCGATAACVDCMVVRPVYDSFTVKFPGVVPTYEEPDTIQRQKNQLFTNFMNHHLGFSKMAYEYLDFIAQCDSVSPPLAPACDSLQQLKNEYLQIRQELQSGMAWGGYRITPAMEEMIEIVNGVLEVSQGRHLNSTLSPRYKYETLNYSTVNKLYTVSTRLPGNWEGDPVEGTYYSGIWPVNSKYIHSNTTVINQYIEDHADALTVLAEDFAGTTRPSDFTKKYYGVSVSVQGIGKLFTMKWGSRDAWDGTCPPSLATYYGVPAPLGKYLHDTVCTTLSCAYNSFSYVKKLINPTSYSEYNSYQADVDNYYISREIKKVLGYSLDTTVIRLYKEASGVPGAAVTSGRFIKARLLLANDTEVDAWMNVVVCTNINVKYTELVDTAIYDPDCEKGFAAFYNSKKGTDYTFAQIDSISQATCGGPLGVCDIPACDSTDWTVYNPGANLEINTDLYTNAVDNISPASQFFAGGYFNGPSAGQASQYVLVNKKDSIEVGSETVLMQWRVKPNAAASMINPFIRRGAATTYVGAQWIKDPTDTTWWIGATILKGEHGTMIKGMGLQSNSDGLQVDWVKITDADTIAILYFEDFQFTSGGCNDSDAASGPFLCGQPATDSALILNMNPCADTAYNAAMGANYLFDIYHQKLKGVFEKAYTSKCLDAGRLESFTVRHPLVEYHYTLYYYDQAGNLIKTVPPEGVHAERDSVWLDEVSEAREENEVLRPPHTLATTYRYNSLNQVIRQHSPDGGLSKFWYDRLGRLVVSQNAKQASEGNYSYTLYDVLGRITEVGQKKQATAITDAIARNQEYLSGWLDYTYTLDETTVIAEQVTKTVYDERDPETGVLPSSDYVLNPSFQKAYTLRNRVSFTRYYDKLGWNGSAALFSDYDNSSTYSYDIHGNVDTLLHHYRTGLMADNHGNNEFKAMAYKYDLVSGKVNEVHYQPGMPDQFYHRYEYDAENRLTDAYTTDRKQLVGIPALEEHEARYDYYKHGPLARTIIGQQQVQGIDYAYTLQGWLKGVNSDSLLDRDGLSGSVVAKDAYRFSLNYFNGDYHPIGQSVTNVFPGYSAYMETISLGDYKPLYNGNISSMVVGIPKLGETKLYNYGYDQLNRLLRMDTWNGYNAVAGDWEDMAKTDEYQERISYDGNGNILTYLRNGNSDQAMDNLTYQYPKDGETGHILNNRLRYVHDQVAEEDGEDITNQTVLSLQDVEDEKLDEQVSDNYRYDVIGNLIKDTKEGIDNIEWTVYGKIRKIEKANGTDISYTYDVAGNRISKTVTGAPSGNGITWYVRDAQGNPMAIYSGTTESLTLSEQSLYGSSRLGVWNRDVNMDAAVDPKNYIFTRGNKFFELSNHLQNVLVTISDKKIGVDENTDGTVDYYNADVITANDYYPFGSQMPGRKYSALSSSYRYGFNGKENDNEVKGEGNQQDYGLRIYDPRLGKFLSIDPLTKDYPWYTPYQFAGNKPIEAIDLDGAEEFYINQQSRVKHEAQLKHVVDERTKVIAAYKNQTILAADIFGNGHIGPRYVVESNIAAVRQNYYNAIGNNIRGGPFGAAGYLIAGDKGSFYGAVADNVALSFGGIPGESSVLSRPNNMSQVKPMSSTEIAPYEHAPLHLTINLKQNWNKEQVTEAFEKAQTITNNLNAKVTLKNPEPRPSNLRKDYLKQGGTLTKGQQLDHTTDLQVNGTNDKSNLRGINGSVNMSFGAQLNMQIRNMPDNTRVRTVTINPFPIKKN